MSTVQFLDEDRFDSSLKRRPKQYTGLVGFVIKLGLAQDEKSANNVLAIVIVVSLALTTFVLINGAKMSTVSNSQDVLPAEF